MWYVPRLLGLLATHVALALPILLVGPGCDPPPVERCLSLLEQGSYTRAVSGCETAYEETGEARAAVGAVRAIIELGDERSLLAWERRLRGAPEEKELLALTARYFRERGETDLTEDRYRRLAQVSERLSDHTGAFEGHYGLFYLAWDRSNFGAALSHVARAFQASQRARDPDAEAKALQGLFVVLYETGALEHAYESLRRAETITPPEDLLHLAHIALNLGVARLAQSRFALAREASERALSLGAEVPGTIFFRSAHLNLVTAHLELGNVDAAEKHLALASGFVDPDEHYPSLVYHAARIDIARSRFVEARAALSEALALEPEPDWRWLLLTRLGEVEEALGNGDAAERAYLEAIEVIEAMRKTLGLDELKSWLLERKREPYEELFRLRAEGGRALEALEVLERAKARAFLDAFVHATSRPAGGGLAPEAALARFEALENLLPSMGSSPVVAPRSVDRLLRDLGDGVVLAYFVASKRLWLARIAGREVVIRPLPATVDELERAVSDFRSRPDDPAESTALARMLLPEADLPTPGTTLHVVTDGSLGQVPFSALRIRGRFLVEDYTLSFVPSLNAMVVLREGMHAGESPPSILASGEMELPGASAEARTLGARLGVEPHIGPEARLAALKRAARAPLLHLALHTGVDHRGPWIQLADETVGGDWILRERVAPTLVVLASCASAARSGTGLWGSLGGAFLAAGSRAVVASLSSVEDQAAKELVERFYAEGGSRTPALALARAQRAFISAGRPPSFWAPFVHLGPAVAVP